MGEMMVQQIISPLTPLHEKLKGNGKEIININQ